MRVIRRNRLVSILILMMLSATTALSQEDASAKRAQEVLGQARAALGGEAKLQAIKGFSASWKFRRMEKNGSQDSGEVQLDFLLPDKFVKNETLSLSGNLGQIVSFNVLNGDQVWSDDHSTNSEIPIMNTGPGGPEQQAALRRGLRKEYASQLLQLLLTTSPYFPVEFAYAGEAQAPDGSADVLDAKGPDNFAVRLFFDKQTHRLMMLNYQEAPIMLTMPPQKKPGKIISQPKAHYDKSGNVEVQVRFSDYRAEDGILVPHLITRVKDGKPNQEAELKSFKVNPSFRPDHFEAKRKH
jgi:hypothetical protein